jgi:serine/threonine protein kinase
VVASPSQPGSIPKYWPSARHFTEVIQCPSVCFAAPVLRNTLPAVDRLGMPIVTSGQFAYVYKLKSMNGDGDFAIRCFRGYLRDRDQRYRAIQNHLQSSPVPYLSEFSYAPEGIMVGGPRFPILFMRWIEGPTLDLYVEEMLHRREVLFHLAAEWLRVISALQTSGIAHGDLQHGNVIVDHGQLRLIDHDGIFVPTMTGWSASEVGHQHYQHPQRTAQHFDANLDSFSALVIYLSLLSLAERPSLWQEYHDENLLFTKADFLNPSSSSLLAKIREIGTEHCRLADILAQAASGPPAAVPRLLDLVQTTSRLPSWISAPADLETTSRTREVVLEAPAEARHARWIPSAKNKGRPVPATPSSPAVQSIFSTPAGASAPAQRDPNAVVRNAFQYTKETFQEHGSWWFWGFFLLFAWGGFGLGESLVVATLSYAMICLIIGLYRSVDEARTARRKQIAHRTGALPTAPPLHGPASWQTVTHLYSLPPATRRSGPLIGNRVLGIYHLPDCDWVGQISKPNLVSFGSSPEASSHGYKPCRICSPAS